MGIDDFLRRPLVRFPEEVAGSDFEETIGNEEEAARRLGCIEEGLKEIGAQLSHDAKVLEVGTGTGNLLRYMQKVGYNIVGVDARPRHKDNLPIAVARIERLPFADQQFDAVISAAIFDDGEYNQDQGMMKDEIVRILKPGGRYIGIFSNGFDIQGLKTDLHSEDLELALYHKE